MQRPAPILVQTISTPVILCLIMLGVALLALTNNSGPFNQTVIDVFVQVVLVVGLYVFIGNSGVISFGHIGFTCLGAYATAWFTIPPLMKKVLLPGLPEFVTQLQMPLLVSLVCSALFAGVFAYLFGRDPDAAVGHRCLDRHLRDAGGHQHRLFQLGRCDGGYKLRGGHSHRTAASGRISWLPSSPSSSPTSTPSRALVWHCGRHATRPLRPVPRACIFRASV
jgi:hypothetical protein